MKKINSVEEVINSGIIRSGSVIYTAGNAATPQVLLKQLAYDTSITNIELLSILLLGDIHDLFSKEACSRITHRVIFNGPHSREAMNNGWATYQLMHLSDIPRQLKQSIKPNVVLLQVSGPDNGGNYSFGTTVEAVKAAVDTARANNGLVIAERNSKMPFVLGTTLHSSDIDYLLDVEYDLPVSPVEEPDDRANRIGRLIAELFIKDGSTLQYGIGEVPEAVTTSIIGKGVKDLGIYTELFSDSMRTLVDKGIVNNRFLRNNFSVSSIFLSADADGYDWLHFNSSIQSRPCEQTNNVLYISAQPRMTAINSAMGVDLHGNIWADSLDARKIYSGIGGQADFLRGSYLSEGGTPIIAMKSTTDKGHHKIMDKCPEGITTTAIAADPVVIVTENGAFNPRGLNIAEHAIGIAHLAAPEQRDRLLKAIYESKAFHKPRKALKESIPKGFVAFEQVFS
ncbi:MAG: acetyl-CoA hydrolase/transferase C-terminal domain-containing protein [Bacteroidales bacterium]|jgi:acyl-CoA hydrolase|nr:acetyl-CoA hydrolase/transferase C-terminal domain-containing protein [Bacteroidales bacterium]